MASVDTRAIEVEIDRIRSLGLEELRREWRRLNHSEPPKISRDLLFLALGRQRALSRCRWACHSVTSAVTIDDDRDQL
jgi:hypothetical protein